MDLDIKVACAFIQVCAFIRVKPLLQVLKEQVKALQERIGDLEKESAGNKMDSAHLAQLEAHVQQFQKGTCCLDGVVSSFLLSVLLFQNTRRQQMLQERSRQKFNGNCCFLIHTTLSHSLHLSLPSASLHDRIMEVSGGRMQQQQAQVDAVKKEIDASAAAITKANVAIKTAERCLSIALATPSSPPPLLTSLPPSLPPSITPETPRKVRTGSPLWRRRLRRPELLLKSSRLHSLHWRRRPRRSSANRRRFT